VLVVAVGDYRPAFCLPFYFRFYLLDSIENVFSRTYVLPKIECIFSAKSCSLGNLSLLTYFQKLYSLQEWIINMAGGGTLRRPRLADR